MEKLNILVTGSTGYIGTELIKLLVKHRGVNIKYLCGHSSIGKSIHLEDFLNIPDAYRNTDLSETWIILKQIRKVITGALEKKRAEKIIGSSLEAHIDIYVESSIIKKIENYSLDEISITSSFAFHEFKDYTKGFSIEEIPNVKIVVTKTEGKKCQRCWKYKEQLIREEICDRCEKAIS